MSGFKQYRRKSISELMPYVEGMDIGEISVSNEDKAAGSPRVGDMIARNPKNHNDQWLVAEQYFKDNLEEMLEEEPTTWQQRLDIEREELADRLNNLSIALAAGAVPVEVVDILEEQKVAMRVYLDILNRRVEQ